MKDVRRVAGWCSFVVASSCFLWPLGCDGRSANQQVTRNLQQQYAKDYQEQLDTLKNQNAEWERQVKKIEEQDARYEAILAKWEEHAKRVDTLLDRWDQVLVVLEKRLSDK
jgi:hypothetical protein